MATEPITSTTTEEDEWMMIGDDDARAALEEAVEDIRVKPWLKKQLEDLRKLKEKTEPKQLKRKIDDHIQFHQSLAHVVRYLGFPGFAWTVEIAKIEFEQVTSDVGAETAESSTTSSSSKAKSIDCLGRYKYD